jgi:hypothetical protein
MVLEVTPCSMVDDELERTCSTYLIEENCVQGFGGKARMKKDI